MLLIPLAILSFAFGANASSCAPPVEGLDLDRRPLEGRWWIQVQYGIPPVTKNPCYNVELSLNSNNRLDNLQSWKVGSETFSESTPEIASPDNSLADSRKGTVYFQLIDGIIATWFLKVNYNEYYAFYGCKNGEEPSFLITTRRQERNETLINEITESVAKIVALPKGVLWTDNTDC